MNMTKMQSFKGNSLWIVLILGLPRSIVFRSEGGRPAPGVRGKPGARPPVFPRRLDGRPEGRPRQGGARVPGRAEIQAGPRDLPRHLEGLLDPREARPGDREREGGGPARGEERQVPAGARGDLPARQQPGRGRRPVRADRADRLHRPHGPDEPRAPLSNSHAVEGGGAVRNDPEAVRAGRRRPGAARPAVRGGG